MKVFTDNISAIGAGTCHSSILRDPDELDSAQWDALLAADPVGALFQGRIWTTAWYRSYGSQFDPLLVAVTRAGTLVGVAPLAIEKGTRRVVFAGDNMADYRDVLALEDARRETIKALMEAYRGGQFPNMLRIGPTAPESPTRHLAPEMARAVGLNVIVRMHAGWRWWPERVRPEDDPMRRKSVRYTLNYFKRQGDVRVEWLRTRQEWDDFKGDFYRQHSLRQIFGGRQVTFDDSRKRAMSDALFDSGLAHVTALRVGDQLVAGHVGCLWNRVLFWGAPTFDIRYKQYSPGLLLVVLTMQRLSDWGLRGFDLTLGEGDLKERFSNERVELPSVDVYPDKTSYSVSVAYSAASKGLKRIVGEELWAEKIRSRVKQIKPKLDRARGRGFGGTVQVTARFALSKLGEMATGLVLIAKPGDVREEPVARRGEERAFHDDQVYDLLKWDGNDQEVAWQITAQARTFADAQRSGRTFHTVLVNDRLAGWGYSYWPSEPALLTETGGTPLEFRSRSVSLYDFYVLPEFRGRKIYQALLGYILRKRFAEGADQAYIAVLERNTPSLRAIQRVGFQVVMRNRYARLWRWKRTRSWKAPES